MVDSKENCKFGIYKIPVFKNVAIRQKNEIHTPFVFSSKSLFWTRKQKAYIFHAYFLIATFFKAGVYIYIHISIIAL